MYKAEYALVRTGLYLEGLKLYPHVLSFFKHKSEREALVLSLCDDVQFCFAPEKHEINAITDLMAVDGEYNISLGNSRSLGNAFWQYTGYFGTRMVMHWQV